MEPADKKNESEVKVIMNALREMKKQHDKDVIDQYAREDALIRRVKALEEHLRSLDHGNEQGNDVRDGGWFD